MQVWRKPVPFLWFVVSCLICPSVFSSHHLYAQEAQSLGDAARRLRAEKTAEAAKSGPPDWATAPAQANHEPISDAQLVGWVLGGVPPEDLLTELHNRGITFLPGRDVEELLREAGAEPRIIEETWKMEPRTSSASNPEAMAMLARIAADKKQQDFRGAIGETLALLKTDSKNPGLYVLLGHLFDEQEEWPGMAGAFSAAIRLDRDFAYSHGQLSLACYRLEDGCAKTEAEAMLNLQPRSADGHKFLGLAYMLMRNAPLAMTEYYKALSLGPRSPDLVYYDIGLVKEMVKDMDGAMDAYRHAIHLNSKNWRALNALGEAYVEQGNIDAGVMNLRKAKAAAPDHLEIRQNLGAALCNSGRHSDAIVEFEELLQLDPDWNMARRCLVKSLKAVGRMDEAQKVQDEYDRRETEQSN